MMIGTKSLIGKTINNPYKIGTSIDRTNNNAPSTAYLLSDNQYVVVNNSTKSIVQVSNLTKADWKIDKDITNIK